MDATSEHPEPETVTNDHVAYDLLDGSKISETVFNAFSAATQEKMIHKITERDGKGITLATLCSGTDAPARALHNDIEIINKKLNVDVGAN